MEGNTKAQLPDNVEELKGIIVSLQKTIGILEEKVKYFQGMVFGRKSEKFSEEDQGQGRLFNEAEVGVEEAADQEAVEAETAEVPAHRRRKRGRKPIPPELPRVEIIHDLTEEQKACGCGATLSRIGEEISEQLDIIPAQIQVLKHIRYKYACKACEGIGTEGGAVKIASAPELIIPKGIGSAGLIAHAITSKFVDAVPFYRQENIFKRIGVEIPRATMCGWAIQVADRSEGLLELMRQNLIAGPYVQIDETGVQVLREPGRANTSRSYMWVYRGGDLDRPTVIFEYSRTRSGEVPLEYLQGYQGYIQTDGYTAYDELGRQPGIVHLGCWAHGRRGFADLAKQTKKAGSAQQALAFIGKLYAVEKRAEGLSVEEIGELRQREAGPVLKRFKEWLGKKREQTPPKGMLGKAVAYTLGQWERLEIYTQDGILKIDNNSCENEIRPFVVGRNNWLFSGHPRGAEASAALYSLVQTARANGLDPYYYLRYLFEHLPKAKTEEDLKGLLVQNLSAEQLLAPG